MQKQVPQAYKTNHASCEFITLPCKQQSTVLEMNSLLLFLFLGASVALAELPFDHPALVEFLNEEGEELFGAELADEENDPRRPRPSPPPFVRVCKGKLKVCLKGKDACGKLECLKKFRECIKSHLPSRRPTLTPPPHVKVCAISARRCFADAGDDCRKKLGCLFCMRRCVKKRRAPRFCRPRRPSFRPTRP